MVRRILPILTWILCGIALISLFLAFMHRWIPETLILNNASRLEKFSLVTYSRTRNKDFVGDTTKLYEKEYCTAKLLGIIPIKTVEVYIFENKEILLGGMLFGVQLSSDFVYISEIKDSWSGEALYSPAKIAGLERLDIVKEINGRKVSTAREAAIAIEDLGGGDLTIKIQRDTVELEVVLIADPSLEIESYYGLCFQDFVIGVGTISYINPKDFSFGGFAHGVKNKNSEDLLSVRDSSVLAARFNSIIKSQRDTPGELLVTYLGNAGIITSNRNTGVFGRLNSLPSIRLEENPIPIGIREDICEGPALLYCTVDNEGVQEYEIEIIAVYNKTQENKDFLIQIVDESLLKKTGGVVSGMSGSPVVQNGKLVGALSHVILFDVTKGYGIFAENMIIDGR